MKKQSVHKQNNMETRLEQLPWYIFMSSIVFVLASFFLIYLVDLRNLFGSRDLLLLYFPQNPFMFLKLFAEAKLVELFQWLLLGVNALISMFISGLTYKKDRLAFLFWSVMAVAFTFMLIEDAGNPRHTIRFYIESIFVNSPGLAGTAFEAMYFTVLASIPIYAFLYCRTPVMKCIRSARYLMAGFIGYGMAAFLSFTGGRLPIRDEALYIYLGGKLRSAMLFLADDQAELLWKQYEAALGRLPFNFYILDWIFEESIELMAAAAFCASAVAFLLHVRKKYEL